MTRDHIDRTERFAECEASRLAELVGLSGLVNSSLDPEAIRRRAIEAACRVTGSQSASLLLLDRSGDLFFEVAVGESGHKLRKQRIPRGQGVAGWVARTRESVTVPDASVDERFDASFDRLTGLATRNLMAVPVTVHGELVGVLEAVNKEDVGGFTSSDVSLLEALADQVGIAIDNSRLYALLRRRLIENWVIAMSCVIITVVTVLLLK